MYHIKNIFILLLLVLMTTGCIRGVKTLETVTTAIEREPLNLKTPPSLTLEEIKFIIITSENADEVFEKMKKNNLDPVLFGLSDEDYELLAKNFAQIRAYILKQSLVINQYKDYYEPSKTDK